jgi:hypothetical protein
MLIVRLFGGDVDESERARALDRMADCAECAGLFADMGSIAAATVAMPVPARPRDFALTEADAARLNGGRDGAGRAWFGLRRSLGGALAALGLAGVVLMSALSVVGGGAATLDQSNAAAPESLSGLAAAPQVPAADGSNVGFAAASPAMPAATTGSMVGAQSSVADTLNGSGGKQVGTPPAAPSSAPIAVANPAYGDGAGGAAQGGTASQPDTSPVTGMDSRMLWLIGFAALFAVGLATLLLPTALTRIRRRQNR